MGQSAGGMGQSAGGRGSARGGGSAKIGQQNEYSLHGGQYASCVHAGGLSCYFNKLPVALAISAESGGGGGFMILRWGLRPWKGASGYNLANFTSV